VAVVAWLRMAVVLDAHGVTPPTRISSAVVVFVRQLSTWSPRSDTYWSDVPGGRRELTSELLLAQPPASNEWFQFRDEFEIDGREPRLYRRAGASPRP
jgi:hypothetical protein